MTEELSPTSELRLKFDDISPETDEVCKKKLWGLTVPPFVSSKIVNWIEDIQIDSPILYKDFYCLRKVIPKLKSNFKFNRKFLFFLIFR